MKILPFENTVSAVLRTIDPDIYDMNKYRTIKSTDTILVQSISSHDWIVFHTAILVEDFHNPDWLTLHATILFNFPFTTIVQNLIFYIFRIRRLQNKFQQLQ